HESFPQRSCRIPTVTLVFGLKRCADGGRDEGNQTSTIGGLAQSILQCVAVGHVSRACKKCVDICSGAPRGKSAEKTNFLLAFESASDTIKDAIRRCAPLRQRLSYSEPLVP